MDFWISETKKNILLHWKQDIYKNYVIPHRYIHKLTTITAYGHVDNYRLLVQLAVTSKIHYKVENSSKKT